MSCSQGRVVRTNEGKARLAGMAMGGKRAKILAAPLAVIIGSDLAFAGKLPSLLVLLPAPCIATMQAHLSEPAVA
jgi:hypothetical protein